MHSQEPDHNKVPGGGLNLRGNKRSVKQGDLECKTVRLRISAKGSRAGTREKGGGSERPPLQRTPRRKPARTGKNYQKAGVRRVTLADRSAEKRKNTATRGPSPESHGEAALAGPKDEEKGDAKKEGRTKTGTTEVGEKKRWRSGPKPPSKRSAGGRKGWTTNLT